MKKPEPHDFGISSEEYRQYNRQVYQVSPQDVFHTRLFKLVWIILCTLGILGLISPILITRDIPHDTRDWGFLQVLIGWFFFSAIPAYVLALAIYRFKKLRLALSPLAHKMNLYYEAEASYQRTLIEHWMSLSGPQFERELGALYQQLGYNVDFTPPSGDQGIDLLLQKNGETTIVQCKSYHHPVGPAVARELYGTLVASGADEAVLACTGGFTRGVREFVRGKPIELISVDDLVRMGESIDEEQIQYQS